MRAFIVLLILIMWISVFLYLVIVGLIIALVLSPNALANAVHVLIEWFPFIILCGVAMTVFDLVLMYFVRAKKSLALYASDRNYFSQVVHFVVKGRYKFEFPIKEPKKL